MGLYFLIKSFKVFKEHNTWYTLSATFVGLRRSSLTVFSVLLVTVWFKFFGAVNEWSSLLKKIAILLFFA